MRKRVRPGFILTSIVAVLAIGLSAIALAALASKLQSGQVPSFALLLLIAAALGIAARWIVGRRGRPAATAEGRRIALQIIEDRLMLLRGLAYADLLKRRGEVVSESVPAPPEAEYQVETEVTWDSSKKPSNLRVTVSVHGGGVGAVRPISGSFIVAPDGSFVGEHSPRPSE